MSMEYTRDNAESVLKQRGAMDTCLACGKTDLRVGERLAGIVSEGDEGELQHGDPDAARLVPVVCVGCGFVQYHDWYVLTR
jgi:hypothetical protein